MRVSMIVWNEFLNDARVFKEAQTLRMNGVEVSVYALHKEGVTKKKQILEFDVYVFRVSRHPLDGFSFKNYIPFFKKRGEVKRDLGGSLLKIISRMWAHSILVSKLARSGADVIHAHDVNVLPTAWLAATLARVPLVYDAHEISTDREGYASFKGLVAWFERRIMPRAAGTITTTDARAKFFARAYGIERPVVLQNRPRLTAVTRNDRIRQELGLTQPWPIVLYQGGIQQGRGLPRLVEAAASVPDAYFVFIGGGRQERELYELREKLGLEDRVHFIPTVALSELPHYTASADIGVQPIENTCLNHFTTDSNKLFEYVIAGLPVVASDMPEIRKVVRQHELGLLIEPGNTKALAEAIQSLVNDPAKRATYAENAREAAQTLNWEDQEHLLVSLYRKIFDQQGNKSAKKDTA
ncbi:MULTISPECIES: glycosyltransferase family 4 protein [Chromohalobacter]|uniref:Glycosyltransferase family 4 protein n=1 Tax=Chromohalobacter moromii TaxID=2860329 RepID=A0A9X3AWE3_9GAMM|nr:MULTISPECIES: glycosyltransferase family 4 protein [Chromohalobacter]MCK2045080.1 glycosyltransferase family 4 protein [Chromohalobacter moromii]MCT8468066.1 glycosyltransferase family 4 protein [Chromohalobacter canadensis]MCT8498565.1 glycosyltransferase family 4 protein [Chromohalobacter canadensis]MCT8503771.1 glycosyltransferase family 4 protein [Chromohalobacter moromii]